jgi:type II secretory ATPase GspE/PulE/Tfp pilus assembly ATPase PilB-like protein
MTPALRQMVARGVPAEELHSAAVAGGMVDLKAYAALLLAQGLTSTEEVTSVVSMGDA